MRTLKIIRIELYVTAKKETLNTVQSVFRITKERGQIINDENPCDTFTNIFNLKKKISNKNMFHHLHLHLTLLSPVEAISMIVFNERP